MVHQAEGNAMNLRRDNVERLSSPKGQKLELAPSIKVISSKRPPSKEVRVKVAGFSPTTGLVSYGRSIEILYSKKAKSAKIYGGAPTGTPKSITVLKNGQKREALVEGMLSSYSLVPKIAATPSIVVVLK